MQVNECLDSKKNELVQALQALIAIPSLKAAPTPNAPFGEDCANALAFVLDEARRLGLCARNQENYYGVVTLPAQNPDAETLGILVHLDVVPTGDLGAWTYPPFGGTIADGRLYGRGSSDDKGPAVAALYALYAAAQQGIPFRRNVQLILGCDEESGWGDIAHFVKTEKLPDIAFSPDAVFPLVNAEKGILHAQIDLAIPNPAQQCAKVVNLQAGTVANCVPNYACAQLQGIDFDVVTTLASAAQAASNVRFVCTQQQSGAQIQAYGTASHGSKPELGANALTALLDLLNQLPFAQNQGMEMLKTLANVFAHGVHDGSRAGIAAHSEQMAHLSASLNVLRYDCASLYALVDIRYPEVTTDAALCKRLCEALGCEVTAKSVTPPHLVGADSELVRTLLRVYTEQTGEQAGCLITGGGTYARAIQNAVSFGALFPNEADCAHMANESIDLLCLQRAAKIYAHAILQLAT